MVTATFYSFGKKLNSTERPAGSGVDYDCEIFDSCGLLAPVLIISDFSVIDYNYCYIDAFNRYYFVADHEFREGRIYVHLDCDVLASWKTSIGASNQYVARASALGDATICDKVYPAKAAAVYSVISESNPLDVPITTGRYIVGINGQKVAYYVVTETQLNVLLSYLFSDDYADEVVGGIYSDIYPELKAQLNPLQYISSIKWVPFNITGGGIPISVGWVSTPAVGYPLTEKSTPTTSVTFTVPKHPQAGGMPSYLNTSPYTLYQLYFPPFGMIQLPSDVMSITDSIYCEVRLDPRTGAGILTVTRQGTGEVIARITASVCAEIQISQITAPGYGPGSIIQASAGAVSGIAGIVSSAMSGGASGIAGAISGGARLVSDTVQTFRDAAESRIPGVNTIGGTGGIAAMSGDCQLITTFLPVVNKDNNHKGTPLCQVKQISEMEGYIEVYWPHLDIAATDTEITQIYRQMEAGFYYE